MVEKNDFVELKFTGRVKDGEIFDTNIKDDAEKIQLKIEEKPFIICIGQEMVIKGLDEELPGKEIGEKYSVELNSKDAFGQRKKELVRLMPKRLFDDKEVNIYPGMTLALDNLLVRIISVSGGRVLADFNNPLAGKDIVYDFTITRKVEDINEKMNSIIDFFIRQKIDFKIDEPNKKIIFEIESFYQPIIDSLNERFKKILEYEMVLKPKKTNKNQNTS